MVGRVKGTFWRWKVKENMIFFINLSEQILTFCHVLHKGPGAGSSHEMKRKKCKNRSKPFGTNHQNLLMWHGPGSSEQGHSRFYVKRQHTAKGAKAQVRLASPSEPGDNVLLRWAQLGSAPRWLEQWLAARGRHYSSLLSTSEWVWKGVLHITDIHNSGLLTQRGDKKRESTVIKHTRCTFQQIEHTLALYLRSRQGKKLPVREVFLLLVRRGLCWRRWPFPLQTRKEVVHRLFF